MSNDQVAAIQDIFRSVLNNNDITITAETTANDVEEWDSLSHIMLVVEIEKHFGKRFASKEIQGWKNVGDMLASING